MEDQKQFNIAKPRTECECLSVRQYVCMREKVPKKNCNLSHSILYQHFTFLFLPFLHFDLLFDGATETNTYYSSQYGLFLVSKNHCSPEMY